MRRKLVKNEIQVETGESLPPYRLTYLDFGMMGRLTPSSSGRNRQHYFGVEY